MPKKEKKGQKEYVPTPYTKDERERKITLIKLQLVDLNMYSVLTPEVHQSISDFIQSGKECDMEVDLPMYSRILVVHLVNDKKKQTYINLKFKKIRVEGEDNNNINKLNEIQEKMFSDDLGVQL